MTRRNAERDVDLQSQISVRPHSPVLLAGRRHRAHATTGVHSACGTDRRCRVQPFCDRPGAAFLSYTRNSSRAMGPRVGCDTGNPIAPHRKRALREICRSGAGALVGGTARWPIRAACSDDVRPVHVKHLCRSRARRCGPELSTDPASSARGLCWLGRLRGCATPPQRRTTPCALLCGRKTAYVRHMAVHIRCITSLDLESRPCALAAYPKSATFSRYVARVPSAGRALIGKLPSIQLSLRFADGSTTASRHGARARY
jgi:hypothetical protein